MIELFEALLSPDRVREIRSLIAAGRFVAGTTTARGPDAQAKDNEQLDTQAPGGAEPGRRLVEALMADRRVRDAVLPQSVRHPVVARYREGMAYGEHLDAPIMTGDVVTRVDVSCTVFLNDPSEYDGGELVMSLGQPLSFKANAGDAIVYPSGTLHEVRPITRGERVVAVTWFQSMVRDAAQRQILWDLSRALRAPGGDAQAERWLRRSYNALVQRWAEP